MAKTTVAEIVRTTGKLEVPENLSLKDAANLLLQKAAEEEEIVSFSHNFDNILPWDGAVALKAVLDDIFSGTAATQGTEVQSFFGTLKKKPEVRAVPCGPNGETVDVPWGSYGLPNGIKLETSGGFSESKRIYFFRVVGLCQRRYIPQVNLIKTKLIDYIRTNSIYRGKAFRIEFTDIHGNYHEEAQIDFIDLARFATDTAIFSPEISEEINALVFGPMSSPNPKKTGCLLAGQPGVGKTLVMSLAAYKAQQAGRTVIYCHSRDFTDALRFAANYEGENGSLVLCEDIDRILAGERDAAIDAIYNAMDGPDTKHTHVSVLLTTNDLSVIPEPFLRPGRVRQTLELEPPNAEAVFELLLLYGNNRLKVPEKVLREVSKNLAGRIPAVIADVVARAFDIAEYNGREVATADDIKVAERSMRKQLELLDSRNRKPVKEHYAVRAAHVLAGAFTHAAPHERLLAAGELNASLEEPMPTPSKGTN